MFLIQLCYVKRNYGSNLPEHTDMCVPEQYKYVLHYIKLIKHIYPLMLTQLYLI
jgi:hypothetical protein